MITDIKLGQAPVLEQGAVEMLLACHQRIRNFTGIANRLADAADAAAPEIANAAEVVHRYYSIALPLHEADENESVYPRLGRRLTDPHERGSLQSMVDQHYPLNEVIERLLPRWADLKTHPEKLASYAADLRADSQRLQQLWEQHLALEEEIVFPLIRERLTPDDLTAIHAEMKKRRGIDG